MWGKSLPGTSGLWPNGHMVTALKFGRVAVNARKGLPAAILLISVCLAAGLGFTAQESCTIEGSVSDPSAKPVAEATVLAMNLRSGESWQTSTDSRGAFQFNQLRTGTYRISVGQSGYEIYESDDLKVDAKKVIRLSVRLKASRNGPRQ
jgi:hypothetical protein